MELTKLFGYLLFAFVTTITPGPNNYMLFQNGKLYGFGESIKLMTGVIAGFFTILLLAGYGIAELLISHNYIALFLKVMGSIWLMHLAYTMINMEVNIVNNKKGKLGFKSGYTMQFINPKAWIMAISGASAFMPNYVNIHISVILFAIIFAIVGIPSSLAWIYLGDSISKILKTKRSNQILGIILFLMMLLSVVMIWLE